MTDSVRIRTILSLFAQTYPKARIALSYSNPWELLVAVILSAQCTDKRVNVVTSRLFSRYKTLDDYVRANPSAFEDEVRSTGFFRNKAKNILASARIIQSKFHGHVPQTMQDLLTLPGVARKTANVVLSNAFGIVEGIAVDTHVLRISQRLRFVPLDRIGGKRAVLYGSSRVDYKKDADPVKVERELMRVIPRTEWMAVTYRIIDHGRAVCTARNPKCADCPLRPYCPVVRV